MQKSQNVFGLDTWQISSAMLMLTMVITMPGSALAAGDLAGGMCAAVGYMTGPVGKAIATSGIIVIAVGALLGRVSWGMAVMIAAGIAGIFGAPTVASTIANGAGGGGEGDFCAVV